MIKIYHNPRCSKSREACEWLIKKKKKFEVIEYLKHPPTKQELTALIQLLGIQPEELVRKKEPIYDEKYKGKKLSDTAWIAAMVKYPVLIERPIVILNDKAVIARPVEKLVEFLK